MSDNLDQILSPVTKRKRLRSHLTSDLCIQPASVFDPLSARLAASLGLDIAILAGSAASATVLGAPDIALLSINDLVEQAKRITRVSNLSLIVDADHGYGNSINVMRTVRDLEAAEVSAITIEDTVLPQRKGFTGEHLISTDELVSKSKAALKARLDPETIIIGRTHALRSVGIKETEIRVDALAKTGVDAIFIVGCNSQDELQVINKSARGLPLMLGGSGINLTEMELAQLNVRIIIKGHSTLLASIKAIYEVLLAQSDGNLQNFPYQNLASSDLMNIALGKDYFESLNSQFMS